jgi:hypothetical protein
MINIMEWLVFSHHSTYLAVVILLLLAFTAQGLTFMIYGQREFCFDDKTAGECSLELGGYMAIAATCAFYAAAIVWCCMPRTDPFCRAQGKNNNLEANAQQSQDYNEFYGANTVANMLEYNEANKGPPPSLEPESVYDSGAAEPVMSPWADSQNRAPIPQIQQSHTDDSSSLPPGFFPADDPAYGFQEEIIQQDSGGFVGHVASWTSSNQNDGQNYQHAASFSPLAPPVEEFDNPFIIDENLPAGNPASRPAYGNLQG